MKDDIDNIITLDSENGSVQVEVIEQTVVDGKVYLLVANVESDIEDDVDECMILEDISKKEESNACYKIVDGDEEEKIFEVFEKILGKEDIKITK